jgi:hypothetical protein
MNEIVIEHVPVGELPLAWRAKLDRAEGTTVTVRIEQEAKVPLPPEEHMSDDPLFGMWRDRQDMADVAGYIRLIRASRFNDDSAKNAG